MSMATVPVLLGRNETHKTLSHRAFENATSLILGLAVLALCAHIAIPLSFTPVPITGQTFGVALIALLWGRNRGVSIVATYLALGFVGAPVLATAGKLGATSGYLGGMLLASIVMGSLADAGWTKSWKRTWLAAFFGSLITFTCGLLVLSAFVPDGTLFAAGFWPFIPGDIVKTLTVATLVTGVAKRAAKSNG